MTAALRIRFIGLDEGHDPKDLPPGTLLRADNCALDDSRRLVKRAGTVGLSKTAVSGSSLAAGKRFLSADVPVVADGTTAWTHIDSIDKWVAFDRPPHWRVTKRPLVDSVLSVKALDVAAYGSWLITAYLDSGSLYAFYKVEDAETGAVVVPVTRLSLNQTSQTVRVLVSGTTAYIMVGYTSDIYVYTLNLTTLALLQVTTIPKLSAGIFDAVIGTPSGGVATLYLLYEKSTPDVVVSSYTLSTLASVATYSFARSGLTSCNVAFCPLADRVLCVTSTTSTATTVVFSLPTGLGSLTASASLYAGVSPSVFVVEKDATNAIAGWSRNSATNDGTEGDRFQTSLYASASLIETIAAQRSTFHVHKVSKPWVTGGRVYVAVSTRPRPLSFVSTAAVVQSSTVVLEVETSASMTGTQGSGHAHVATLENSTGWYGSDQIAATLDSSGVAWVPSAYRYREPQNITETMAIGWNVYRLASATGDTFGSAKYGQSALCAGGAPAWFDGASTRPYGFAHAPQIISVTAVAGGSMDVGVHSYIATYLWRDAHGVMHRSAPSPAVTGTTSGGNLRLDVYVSATGVSAKPIVPTHLYAANPVYIEIWRTLVGGTGPHYRLTFEPSYWYLVNPVGAVGATINDTAADANITGSGGVLLSEQPQLYTELGELDNVPPPAFVTVASHKGRLVGIGPDLRTLWLSKDSTLDPTLAPGFNEVLTLAFTHDKTALASMDAVLVVFGEDKIDIVLGDGPDDAGNQSDWRVQAVHTDVGCVNPRSVVVFPGGVLFESRIGISLLDRGLTTAWPGSRIVSTLASYPTITSAVLVASEGEVRWTCDNGTIGVVLVFDYMADHWFVRKYKDVSDTGAVSVRFVDAALIDGVYSLLTAGGQVYQETSAHHYDNGTSYVERDILLAHVSAQPGRAGWVNDNLGWARVKDLTLMGTSTGDHDLEVSFAHDYGAVSQTKLFMSGLDVTAPLAADGSVEKARITLARQKSQAVQIRLRDLAPTSGSGGTGGAGPIFESLLLRVGPLNGPAKTTEGQRG